MFGGFICTLVSPGRHFSTPWKYLINDHELLAVGIGCVLVALVAARRPRRSVTLMMSVGYALGMAGSITMLAPEVNKSIITFPGLIATMLALGFIFSSRAYSGLLAGLSAALRPNDQDTKREP